MDTTVLDFPAHKVRLLIAQTQHSVYWLPLTYEFLEAVTFAGVSGNTDFRIQVFYSATPPAFEGNPFNVDHDGKINARLKKKLDLSYDIRDAFSDFATRAEGYRQGGGWLFPDGDDEFGYAMQPAGAD